MMSNWEKIVGSLAPTIATALGGPLAGTATKFIAGKLLGDENASEQDISAAIMGANPDQLAQLKKIDNDFKIEMERVGVDIFALEVDDRKDARALASKNMWPQIVLSAVFIVGYFLVVYALVTGEIAVAPENSQLVMVLMGVLTAGVANIMQFWFGSSHGSKNKDAPKGG